MRFKGSDEVWEQVITLDDKVVLTLHEDDPLAYADIPDEQAAQIIADVAERRRLKAEAQSAADPPTAV